MSTSPYHPATGLTKREYFAALAMQGLLTAQPSPDELEAIPNDAVAFADALIAALNDIPVKS